MIIENIFHKWLVKLNMQDFYKIMNELYPDLQFLFEELTTDIILFNINLKKICNKLHFDVYYKPTNSSSYIHYKSCHPPHTKNNVAFSLDRRIVRIAPDNKKNQLHELKYHLIKSKYSE